MKYFIDGKKVSAKKAAEIAGKNRLEKVTMQPRGTADIRIWTRDGIMTIKK